MLYDLIMTGLDAWVPFFLLPAVGMNRVGNRLPSCLAWCPPSYWYWAKEKWKTSLSLAYPTVVAAWTKDGSLKDVCEDAKQFAL